MKTHMFFNLVISFIFTFSLFGMLAPVSAQEPPPNPYIDVRANNDQIEAWEWPLGSTLIVNIYISGIEIPPQILRTLRRLPARLPGETPGTMCPSLSTVPLILNRDTW